MGERLMRRRSHLATMPFTKCADLQADQAELQPYYDQIDAIPDILHGQHPIRRWEYAMALRAIDAWEELHDTEWSLRICDVGGAGSNFWRCLRQLTTAQDLWVVDPKFTSPWSADDACPAGCTVEAFAADERYPHGQFDVITAISVMEHVKDQWPFFRAIHMLLKPGGLLFLTTDCWDKDGLDVADMYWMRERIWNPEDLQRKLLHRLRELGYKSFGTADWTYHGHTLLDYSVCSIALTRKA